MFRDSQFEISWLSDEILSAFLADFLSRCSSLRVITMLDHDEFAEFVRQSKSGDHAAFLALVAKASPEVDATIQAVVGRQAHLDMDEIRQGALTKAWASMAVMHSSTFAGFKAWLKRIARNEAIDVAKRRRGQPLPETESGALLGPPASSKSSPTRKAVRNENINRVQQALSLLTADEQLLIKMHDFDGNSSAEVAAFLGISEVAVRQRHSRARRKLKQLLDERDASHGPE